LPAAGPRLDLEFSALRQFSFSLLLSLASFTVDVAAATSFAGPEVRDIIEFTQIVQPVNQNDDTLHEQVSPDGTRAFIVTRKADIASDTNRYEIQLLDLRPDQLAAQTSPSPAAVFSASVEKDFTFTDPGVKQVRWHDDHTLVFLARLGASPFQVYSLDIPKRKLTRLTSETNLIVSYAVSQDLRRIVYAANVQNPPQRAGTHDVVVGNRSFWSVKFGQDDLGAQQRKYQYFVADRAGAGDSRPLGAPFAESNGAYPTISMSPDGRWAVLPRYEPERLEAWERQYTLVAETASTFALTRKIDPLGYFLKTSNYVPRRMTAWDLNGGKEQVVVDAPDDALPGTTQFPQTRLWQGTGTSVVLAGTLLPAGSDGKTSQASHVVEYWPQRRQWAEIATLEGRADGVHATRDGFFVIDGEKRRAFQRLPSGGWRESTADTAMKGTQDSTWTLRTIQDPNRPPDVYAVGPAGETRRLTRLNPQFDADTWGTMKPFSWRDAQGQQWDGGLMVGAGTDPHARYPLLIQTYGFAPNRFYLDGTNLVDGASSGFAGRALLRHRILVLAMPFRATNDPSQDQTRQTFNDFDAGVRGAIEALVKEGRVDPSKVGIIGWSATGERVLNLLTFGDVPLRAATMADADANTLFSYTITYGRMDTTWVRKEKSNEGAPFGDQLASWVREDPSLHTDCIRTPLRIETYGRSVGNNWDLQALLRRQYKPVEMIVIPTGAHSLGGPGDRMTSLQGNVDWFSFWLTGQTRVEPLATWETHETLAEQFARWRQMETLKVADDARPRCAR
jgi:dipeptidyl aminopeptidase/acylaminoacyl peptidase